MKKLFSLLTFVILSLTAISFQSCKDDKFTVWTETETYSQFETYFKTTLSDGHYIRWEVTDEQWEQIVPELTSEGKHRWKEEDIKKWLIGNGFGESEAQKESSWLAVTKHGFIASRDGNWVYLLLK